MTLKNDNRFQNYTQYLKTLDTIKYLDIIKNPEPKSVPHAARGTDFRVLYLIVLSYLDYIERSALI